MHMHLHNIFITTFPQLRRAAAIAHSRCENEAAVFLRTFKYSRSPGGMAGRGLNAVYLTPSNTIWKGVRERPTGWKLALLGVMDCAI